LIDGYSDSHSAEATMHRRMWPALAVLVGGFALPPANVLSQGAGEPFPFPSYPQFSTRRDLMEGIKLTPQQVDSAFAITTRLLDKMRAMGPQMGSASREIRTQKMSELATEHATALRTLLTTNQQARFDSNYAAWDKARKQRVP